jgi:hypothetical protein
MQNIIAALLQEPQNCGTCMMQEEKRDRKSAAKTVPDKQNSTELGMYLPSVKVRE